MASIYTDNFGRSLARVYAKSDLKQEVGLNRVDRSKIFEGVLESVENKAILPDVKVKDQSLIAPNEQLTNLSEKEVIPQKFHHPVTEPPFIIGDIPLNEDEVSVNNQSLADNITAQPVNIPETPKIVASRRYSLPQGRDLAGMITDKKDIKNIIVTAGKYHGVDPSLGLAVAQAESSLRPDAVSSDGFYSKGIFQLLDSTAADMQELTGLTEKYQPFDPSMNSFLGMAYLRRLHDIFSQNTSLSSYTSTVAAKSAGELEKIAVAAYNAGEGSVARAQAKAKALGKDPSIYSSIEEHLPAITRGYVKRVTGLRQELSRIINSDNIA
ncbi:MAG TPA: transglycosylase SLT domain-containing protein [Oligoflexia bacterium]|nr:transglycosylase SLT domain-containing protein [Oligoflexia bacterium]HMP47337.1 transglycosylase SLT domain-containing protein [Oligoflexia bacterium]